MVLFFLTLLLGVGGALFSACAHKVHPKGTGVVVDCPDGLPAHTFVNEYIGELYPPWRWYGTGGAPEAETGAMR